MKTKFVATLLIVLAVLFGQVGGVLAAPVAQETTPIEGTVTAISTETVDGVTTVLVTVENVMGTQTYRLSVEDADALDLVTVDTATNTVTVDDTKVNQPISFDPALVIDDEEAVDEEPFNPVAGMLASFFNVSNTEINDMHEAGSGFGLIAQALWMSKDLTESENGDPILAGCILDAKKGIVAYDKCFVFGDEPIPTNWGQFKQSLKENKDKHNLGVIMSGHAGESVDDATGNQGKGNGKDKKNDKGNNGKGKNP
jgi:hypothetical protein